MTVESRKHNAAVLVGNGLSIAFNPELKLDSITREMIARMQGATDNGDKVIHAMNEIARRSGPPEEVTDEDFEKLVGAFDSEARTLEELGKLAELVEAEDTALQSAIAEVSKFSDRVRDRGLSYVLEVVTDRSRADHILHKEVHDVLRAIIDSFDGVVTFGNLNYDTLLLSGLLAVDAPLSDLGRGVVPISIRVVDSDGETTSSIPYDAKYLRTSLDFPPGERYRVRLLQLHGSLTFWGQVEGDVHIKVPIQSLRDHNIWSGLREAEPRWRPSVVLANQREKARHVERYPYRLAYEGFAASLTEADHWLIIGYSFRDSCVNEVLRREFITRKDKPNVLVSTYGALPTDEEIATAIGWGAEDGDAKWLTVNRDGVRGLQNDFDWFLFAPRKSS
ncbi:hypothetical protein GCM10009688_18660 [Arthrobacter gandavensis]|uniref:SIR2-like domain-containing protein n=1 Tax=Arthrobacter gandavensis TaxID=169960 RepID=A0ABN2P6X6_9MICC|nr:SIR2 family protein [Arthrobacter citreus]